MVNHLFYPFFTSELQKPESVSSMFPLGEGTNASFTQLLCNEGFLPSSVGNSLNPNSLWWVHMGISLKERQITEEPMKVKIWRKKIANPQASSVEQFVFSDLSLKFSHYTVLEQNV